MEYDNKQITEDFFAHRGLNIRKKTDLKKAVAFMKKASWEDTFISEKYESLEWSELDEKVGRMRLEIMKKYLKERADGK